MSYNNVDPATIANNLRDIATEEEGNGYLTRQNLSRAELDAVASCLQMTRTSGMSKSELHRRVIRQAIGARNKFAGLREGWQR